MNDVPHERLVPGESNETSERDTQLLRELVSEHYAKQLDSIILYASDPEIARSIMPVIEEIIPEANSRIQTFSVERLYMLRAIIIQIDVLSKRYAQIEYQVDELVADSSRNEADGLQGGQVELIFERVRLARDIDRLWAVYESILPPLPKIRLP